MCLIIVCPPGHTPEKEVFVETIAQNHDGSGWAMRNGNTIISGKSAKDTEILDDFLAAREAHPQEWAMWHSRLASQGTKARTTTSILSRYPTAPGSWHTTVLYISTTCPFPNGFR